MRFYRKRFSRRPRRRIFRRKGGFRKKLGLKRIIKKIVNRKLETKEYAQVVLNTTAVQQSTYGGLVANAFNIIPPISAGTGNGQRIGDKISPVSLSYRMWVNMNRTVNYGVVCRLIVFAVKDYNADIMGSTLPNVEAQNFFRSGTSTGTVNGYVYNDILGWINHQRIHVYHDKKFILGTNASPAAPGDSYRNADPMKPANHLLNFTIKNNKRWMYDENATNPNLPTNHNIFAVLLCNAADASVGDNAGTVSWIINGNVKYKDA